MQGPFTVLCIFIALTLLDFSQYSKLSAPELVIIAKNNIGDDDCIGQSATFRSAGRRISLAHPPLNLAMVSQVSANIGSHCLRFMMWFLHMFMKS